MGTAHRRHPGGAGHNCALPRWTPPPVPRPASRRATAPAGPDSSRCFPPPNLLTASRCVPGWDRKPKSRPHALPTRYATGLPSNAPPRAAARARRGCAPPPAAPNHAGARFPVNGPTQILGHLGAWPGRARPPPWGARGPAPGPVEPVPQRRTSGRLAMGLVAGRSTLPTGRATVPKGRTGRRTASCLMQ